MFISKFKVFNYKSYLDSGLIEFTPGINIIVGQNNSGKTSLLEALTLNFDNQPHLSLKTLPNKFLIIKEQSIIEVYLTLEKKNYGLSYNKVRLQLEFMHHQKYTLITKIIHSNVMRFH